jgi:cell division protein FtsW
MAHKLKVDKPFLISALMLMVLGFFIFSSASLGLLARNSASYSSVAFSQTVLGLFLGIIALITFSKLDHKYWRKYAFYVLFLAIILNILVFVPGLGYEHGGAKRWISVAGMSLQPVEFLKLAFIIYFSAWAAGAKERIKTFRHGLMPLLILFAISAALLLSQPDTGSLVLIGLAGTAIFISAGGRWRHILTLGLIAILCLVLLSFARPYVKDRIMTFVDPQRDPQGSSYQVRQSLIAIGSGGAFGRGFGQSLQKVTFLPEPVGDSIFAVAAEEFGFLGAVIILLLFVFFATRGLKIASRVPDSFGRLLIIGIVIMIISQAFVNIGAMLGVVPLSGITLPFVSHGGTSLLVTLAEVGIILSISRTQKTKKTN